MDFSDELNMFAKSTPLSLGLVLLDISLISQSKVRSREILQGGFFFLF